MWNVSQLFTPDIVMNYFFCYVEVDRNRHDSFLSFLWLIRHMLMIVDNEEFYEQEKPLSLEDIRCLIIILRQVILVDKLQLYCQGKKGMQKRAIMGVIFLMVGF